jgi:hypothetical protein
VDARQRPADCKSDMACRRRSRTRRAECCRRPPKAGLDDSRRLIRCCCRLCSASRSRGYCLDKTRIKISGWSILAIYSFEFARRRHSNQTSVTITAATSQMPSKVVPVGKVKKPR